MHSAAVASLALKPLQPSAGAGLWDELLDWGARALSWVASATGVPWLVLVGLMLVLSWRVFKRVAVVVLEVLLLFAVLVGATALGWIHW